MRNRLVNTLVNRVEGLREFVGRGGPRAAKEWKNNEYFDESWKNRIETMASFVPPHSVVMDLGCGLQWLRGYLEGGRYIPVDYCSRSADTLVCDFNNHEFPDVDVDVSFVSGCLEYILEPEWFVKKIVAHSKMCVISYCTVESYPIARVRTSLGWRNSLGATELVQLFDNAGMRLHAETAVANNSIFCFLS